MLSTATLRAVIDCCDRQDHSIGTPSSQQRPAGLEAVIMSDFTDDISVKMCILGGTRQRQVEHVNVLRDTRSQINKLGVYHRLIR